MKITYLLVIFLLSVTFTQSFPGVADPVLYYEYLECKKYKRCSRK